MKTRYLEFQTQLLENAQVPTDPRVQGRIRAQSRDKARSLGVPVLGEEKLAHCADELLAALELPPALRLYTMVEMHNALSWSWFVQVPYSKRLLLLPHCLRDSEACQGILSQGLLECKRCGRCAIADLLETAEELGYNVLISEDASSVLETLMVTGARAVLGVSCLKTLWKVFPWVAQFGLHGQAIPLLRDGCRDTEVDTERVRQVLNAETAAPPAACSTAGDGATPFRPVFARMLGLLGKPQDKTEHIAHEWVNRGGKRVRSFLVVAIYTLLTRSRTVPEGVLRIALAIELFHKASLIHDDIEDQELTRYGRATVHREYGIPVAINIGDYLVGKGYELIVSAADELGPEKTTAILTHLSRTHVNVTRGQGQELLWTHGTDKKIDRDGVEAIYALKTAPFFEIAGRVGLIMAGKGEGGGALGRFARHMGIAYQILDDIGDPGPGPNQTINDDVTGGKPTILLALALEQAQQADRARLHALYSKKRRTPEEAQEVTELYHRCGAVERAYEVCHGHYRSALAALDDVAEPRLRRLLGDLVEYRLGRKLPRHVRSMG